MAYTQILTRRGTASNWSSANTILGSGEFGFETDTLKLKVGDGVTAWNSLAYFNPSFGSYQPLDATLTALSGYNSNGLIKQTAPDTFSAAVADTDYLTPTTAGSTYAPIANGVTNGNSHDHNGGDGAQIAYSSLSGAPTLGTSSSKDVAPTGDASATQVVLGNDSRLTDARTPTSHTTASHSDWPAGVTMTEVGYLDNVTSSIQTQLNGKQATGSYELTTNKNAVGGYAGLDGSGKISSSQLPAIAITNTYTVASQVAMLALTAETGDVAVRTDENKSYILAGTDPTVLGDWQMLLTPTDSVTSVFSRTGVVTASNGDYTASQITNIAAGNIAAVTVQAALNELDTEKAAVGQTTYVGTTAITLNRTSAAQSLTGITSIDGSAATLTTSRTINGTGFDGSANITVEPYVESDESTNSARYIVFVDSSTDGYQRLNEDSGLSYNPSTNTLTTTTFSGALSGNATTATSTTNIAGGATGSIPYQSGAGATSLLSAGTAGYILTTNGAGVAPSWNAPSAASSVSVTATDSAGTYYPVFTSSTGGTATLNVDPTTTPLSYNPNTGVFTSRVLASNVATGTSPLTVASTTAVTNLNADLLDGQHASAFSLLAGSSSITTVGTVTTGTWSATTIAVNKGGTGATTLTGILKGNGTSAFTAATAGTDYLAPTTLDWQVKSGAYTAVNRDRLAVNTSGGAVTITLPITPATGTHVEFTDSGGAFATNNLTIARNGQTIMGLAEDMTVSTNNVSFGLTFNGSTWRTF